MRGLFFSLILVFLLFVLIVIVFMQRSLVARAYTQVVIEGRADAMRNFYSGLIDDSKRAISIVSRRAISAAVSHVISAGVGMSEANKTIVELIVNGTINGEKHALMNDSTIIDWKNKVEKLGLLENFVTNISIKDITVTPFDSFGIKIGFTIYVNISDKSFEMNLSRSERLTTYIDITNFEDPLYPLYTYGRAVNVFVKSPHWLNYSSEDLKNLQDDVNNSYYHPSKYGASFLDRLEGKCFVQDKYKTDGYIGLESFVDKEKLLTLGIPIYPERSSIDYLYFSNIPATAYRIAGMSNTSYYRYFRLDNETTIEGKTHLEVYNVTILSE